MVGPSISEPLWGSHTSFLAVNTAHEKGEARLESSEEAEEDFMHGCLWQQMYSPPPSSSPSPRKHFLFAKTSLLLKWLAKLVVLLCALLLLLWELWELGVADRDNVALWLELSAADSAAVARFHLREEEGGGGGGGWQRRLLVRSEVFASSLSSCVTSCKVTCEDVGVARTHKISAARF